MTELVHTFATSYQVWTKIEEPNEASERGTKMQRVENGTEMPPPGLAQPGIAGMGWKHAKQSWGR